MKEIKIKALNASIYADELHEITDGNIRFYDSEKHYLDYWEEQSLYDLAEENNETVEQEYELDNLPSVDDFIKELEGDDE